MTLLVVGLIIFLGVHSLRIVAEPWRQAQIARRGAGPIKGVYALVSLLGLLLIVSGYASARAQPIALWSPPPAALRHIAALLVLLAFVLVTAAYVPGNGIKARLHHPMVLGVKAWALGHLIANHTLADALLFGSFLAWAVASFIAARRRDRAAGTVYPPGVASRTAITVVVGTLAWAGFAFWAHGALFGVRPFG